MHWVNLIMGTLTEMLNALWTYTYLISQNSFNINPLKWYTLYHKSFLFHRTGCHVFLLWHIMDLFEIFVSEFFDNLAYVHTLCDSFICFFTGLGAMCYCSAILRGLMATLIYFWDSCRDKMAASSPRQLAASTFVISYLKKVNIGDNWRLQCVFIVTRNMSFCVFL